MIQCRLGMVASLKTKRAFVEVEGGLDFKCRLFHTIQKTVNNETLTALSHRCKTLNQLKQIHAHIIQSHLHRNPYAIAPVLSIAATSKDPAFFSYALSIFEYYCQRNTFMHNTMIRGYVQAHLPLPAILCYLDMLDNGVATNNYTFPPLIKACTVLLPRSKASARLVHGHVLKNGFGDDPFTVSALVEFYAASQDIEIGRLLFDRVPKKDVVLWTAMIDGYGKMGDIENARGMFEEMPEKNTISWSAMMAAYSRLSDFRQVLSLFWEMQKVGTRPNESVLVSVLTACAHLGALMQGLWIHSYAKRYNLDSNPILSTALVDMYSRCGCLDSALSVFECIRDKDAGAWNAMISGFALNGNARKSIELFQQMAVKGTTPTETTFVAVLTACTHGRLVPEGLKIFEQMNNVYGVKPKEEHYACVIDLLSRAGMIEEAEKFVEEKMGGIEWTGANVWGALLNACKIHKKFEIGDRIWKKLAAMGVADCGTHVLSYNIYKEAGWDVEANRVRRLIYDVGMRKKPGCSTIEVNNVVHEFLAGDLYNPQSDEICNILNSFIKMVNLEDIFET